MKLLNAARNDAVIEQELEQDQREAAEQDDANQTGRRQPGIEDGDQFLLAVKNADRPKPGDQSRNREESRNVGRQAKQGVIQENAPGVLAQRYDVLAGLHQIGGQREGRRAGDHQRAAKKKLAYDVNGESLHRTCEPFARPRL